MSIHDQLARFSASFRSNKIDGDFKREGSTGKPVFSAGYLLARIHFIIVMVRCFGLAPWEFEFPFPGSFISTFLMRTSGVPTQRAGYDKISRMTLQ